MMTKKQLCEVLIKREEDDGVISVGQSSTYAVCKDLLGELEREESEYAKERGGQIIFMGADRAGNWHSISLRESIDLLPD